MNFTKKWVPGHAAQSENLIQIIAGDEQPAAATEPAAAESATVVEEEEVHSAATEAAAEGAAAAEAAAGETAAVEAAATGWVLLLSLLGDHRTLSLSGLAKCHHILSVSV